MQQYCKAYKLEDLRRFSGWIEKPEADGTDLADDEICFIWDDFVVQAKSPFPEGRYIFDNVTPEWKEFCKRTLQFEIPEDVLFAYENPSEAQAIN